MNRTLLRWILLVACPVAVPLARQAEVYGSTKKAYRHVNDGIQHYRAGDFEAADRAFAEADVALPEDERIAYDRACVFAARGDADRAIELFRQAAMSRDAQLAASSHYNLGCAVAAKAKAVFGDSPEQATPEVRAKGLSLLASAIAHYRDCLEIEPNHSSARRNLELLRLWIKHMQDTWAKRDREKQRDEMDLLAFLQMIEIQQTGLRRAVKHLQEQKDSPRRRQATKQVKVEQVRLRDEIYTVIAPFQNVLQKATTTEDGLVNNSKGVVERSEEADDREDPRPIDYPDLAHSQRRVEGWSEVLPMKAEAELQRIETAPSAAGGPGAAQMGMGPGTDPLQAEQAKEALKESLDKAIELGPKIQGLCDEAAKSLENEDASAALPRQEEALKLLKEIAESLPKEPQQNQEQDDQKQQQDNQQEKPKQKPSGGDQKQQQRPQDLSRQQAEAVLRKVRERERDHRENQKELRRFLQGGVVVEKDW